MYSSVHTRAILQFLFFFLASLGDASTITLTIAASDDAHGVFQFSANSLSVNGTEPEESHSSVILQVWQDLVSHLFVIHILKVTLIWDMNDTS